MDENTSVVYEVQSYLRTIAETNTSITMLVPDGIFGDETTRAVTEFQREYNLPQTGKVNLETWNKLVSENKRIRSERARPIQVAPIENSDLPLRKGDQNSFVLTLQQMLIHLSSTYQNITVVSPSGFFDDNTEKAITQWQKVAFLPQTGIADKETWNMLAEYYLMGRENQVTA